MKSLFVIFILVALFHAAFADTVILEPSEISIQVPTPPKYPPEDFQANAAVRVTIEAPSDWSLSCLYEALSDGSHLIPGDRFFVKKQGEDFVPMTTTIHLGSGGDTGGNFVEVNTLEFQAHILPTDPPAIYYGSVKFIDDSEQEMAVLPITLNIDSYMNFSVQEQAGPIVFTVDGEPGVYTPDNDTPASLQVDGNTEAWQLKASYESTEPTCNLLGNNHYIRCDELPFEQNEGAGIGFKHLGYDRVILEGQSAGISNQAQLFFRLETTYDLSPGQYNSTLLIDSPEFSAPQSVNLEINVEEYLAIEVSESQVSIESEGPPGEYEADKQVKLKVASNTSKWEARAQGEELKSDDDEIPASRLYINSSAKSENGYMALDQEQVVASGSATNMTEVSDLNIKVLTEWEDKAGQYNGNIYFTVIALP